MMLVVQSTVDIIMMLVVQSTVDIIRITHVNWSIPVEHYVLQVSSHLLKSGKKYSIFILEHGNNVL